MKVYELLFFFSLSRDGLSHSAKRLTESHRLDLLRNITELLGRTFSSQFVFPVLGHEDVPYNDYKDYKSFLHSLGGIWRQWLPVEALQTFEKGKFKSNKKEREVNSPYKSHKNTKEKPRNLTKCCYLLLLLDHGKLIWKRD